MNNKVIVIVIVVALPLLVFCLWYFSATASPYGNLPAFAACLRDKQVTMYGTYWCPHCRNEKARFGSSFKFVPYVECTQEVAKCTAANVTGYPTWIFPDLPDSLRQPDKTSFLAGDSKQAGGRRLEGDQSLETLARESGCTLEYAK
jgi:hypothetical protein